MLVRNCLSALNDPIWKLIVSILLFLEGAGCALLCQTAPTAGDRAGADCRPGISVGTAGQRLHHRPSLPSYKFHPTTRAPASLSLLQDCADPKLSERGALGVKGVQADGQDLACRMLTIRQKTLIGYN